MEELREKSLKRNLRKRGSLTCLGKNGRGEREKKESTYGRWGCQWEGSKNNKCKLTFKLIRSVKDNTYSFLVGT